MGIGLGVFLIVIGGILSFTRLDDTLLKTNLDAVGYILMIGGLLALIFGTIQNRQRANTSHTSDGECRGGSCPAPLPGRTSSVTPRLRRPTRARP